MVTHTHRYTAQIEKPQTCLYAEVYGFVVGGSFYDYLFAVNRLVRLTAHGFNTPPLGASPLLAHVARCA